MKFFLISAIIASLLGGCSWVQSLRGIPQPAPENKVKSSQETPKPVAVNVVPRNHEAKPTYMEQRKSEIFSLKPTKRKLRAIEGESEVERAALKEVYDEMDTNLEKNRNKVFSF